MADYSKITQDWKCLQNGLPYKWVVDYASYNAYGNFELSSEDWEKRDYIVNFKGNSELTTENDHQQALSKAISDITALIKSCFGDAAQQFTFVCIPASTQANTARRFEQFSQQVTTYHHFIRRHPRAVLPRDFRENINNPLERKLKKRYVTELNFSRNGKRYGI